MHAQFSTFHSGARVISRGAMLRAVAGAALGLIALTSPALAEPGAAPRSFAERFSDYGQGLPPADIRFGANGALAPAVLDALKAWQGSASGVAVSAAEAGLASQFATLRSYRDPALGSVNWLGATSEFLTGASQDPATDVVKSFLASNPGLFEVGPTLLDKSNLLRSFTTPGTNATHLTWQQTIGGVPITNARLNANVTSDGRLINIGSTMLPEPDGGFVTGKFELSHEQAIHAAAKACGITLAADCTPTGENGIDGATLWKPAAELRQDEPVQTKQVYYAVSRNDVRAAYWVVVPVRGVGHMYELIVDATSGELLYRLNALVWETTQPATYRVYTSDSPQPASPGAQSPNNQQFPFVPRQAVTVQPADISEINPNGWIADGGTQTVGNNTDAYTDAANDNTSSAADRATSATRNFDFVINAGADNAPIDAPGAYRDAAITQLFYFTNRYHDRLWQLGFNEAAGNFQTNNFGRGGTQGDAVLAEAQDGGGTNNANFSTLGSDGSSGRMQMYVFTGATPDRDGTLDGDIVYHELSHGLSIRLHGPQGGLGSGNQSRGMGEGWSDFFGLALNAEPGDDFTQAYSTGSYATRDFPGIGTLNAYYGIRRYPYSIDFAKSPLLYGDINPNIGPRTYAAPRNTAFANTADEVHNVGEVWCNTLLEARYQISLTEGFAANNTMMQLVVDGMKLAPGSPNFLQERDAILQADMVRYGGSHQFALWTAFARRGLGSGAQSADASASSAIENFQIPFRVDYTFPNGTPTQLSPTSATSFPVQAAPFNLTITPGTGRIFYAVGSGAFTSAPLTEVGSGSFVATLPAAACFSNFRYYLSFDTNVGARTSPANAPASTFSGQVFTQTTVFASDDMEIDRGWTVSAGSPAATTGIWNRVAPSATTTTAGLPIQPGVDTTPAPGTRCWVTDGAAATAVGTNDVDSGITILTSPVYNMASANAPIVEYFRWYANNGNTAVDDTFNIEVTTNNGATWVPAETLTTSSNAWVRASWSFASLGLTPTSQVRLRFIASDINTGSIVEAAIDDLLITDRLCNAPVCDPDLNQDGNSDQGDIDYLINVIAGGNNPSGIDPDFNRDGNSDQGDIDALVNVIAGGACP